MHIFLYTLILSLPLYNVRIPTEMYGRAPEFSVVEVAVWLFVFSVFAKERGQGFLRVKDIFSEKLSAASLAPRSFLSSIFYLLSSRLPALSLAALFLGLGIGIFFTNDIAVTLGIIRGWFVAPIALFLALCAWRDFPQHQKSAIGALTLSGAIASSVSFFWPDGLNYDGRLQGFYGSPNYLAMYITPLLPLAFYQWRQAPHGPWRYAWLARATVMAWAVFFSFSHGAWLGLAVGGVFLGYIFLREKIIGLMLSIKSFFTTPLSTIYYLLSTIFLFTAAWGVWQVLGGALTSELQSRLGLWQAAVNIGLNNPLFGIGAGMFPEAYQLQKHIIEHPVPLEAALHPHNIFLTFWLYGGILGLAGFFGILWWLSRQILGGSDPPRQAIILGAAFIIILAHGLVDTTYWKNDLAFMWWILMAVVVVVTKKLARG